MSTGGTGGNPIQGFNYGAKNAQHNINLSDDPDPKGTAAGYIPSQSQDKSFLGSLKEALKPGDTKKQQGSGYRGDFTHDGRHGGVEETMMKGHRDYDESQEGVQNHRDGTKASGILASMMPGHKDREDKETGTFGAMKSATDNYLGPQPGEDEHAATRVSAFDSQGSVGHQFSSEGAIGGTAHKIGGPFSKEGVVGRQFADKGSVGGTVQDTVGHADVTRKGV